MALVLKSHKAKKNFGQNFLHDDFWIEKIASAVDAQPGQNIVEIGPGQAALTRLMIRDAGCVTCIEIDKDLAQWLQKKFKPEELALIEADVLKVDFSRIKPGEKIRLVGNLPYNISSPLLFRLMELADRVIDQHFMLQKEVVDRMAATPGHKAFGRLSVMLQHRYKIVKLFDVPPDAFSPPPKVISSVVRMIPLESPLPVNEKLFERVTAQAFSMKRKTLKNNFAKYFGPEILEEAGIDPGARAEAVSMPSFVVLTNLLESKGILLNDCVSSSSD